MNIFAIDLGNSRIKMKSMIAEYDYPASYLDFKQIGDIHLESISNKNMTDGQNFKFEWSDDNGSEFIWGENINKYALPEKTISTYSRTGRFGQKKVRRILEFALGRLAKDFTTEGDSPIVVALTIGLSITDMNNGTKELLEKHLIGEHNITIDGQNISLVIPSKNHLVILPQYMGTLINYSYNDNFEKNLKYSDGRIGIIDIGGGTILANRSVRMTLDPIGEEVFEGIHELAKEIAHRTDKTKIQYIEETLRFGKNHEGRYIYQSDSNAWSQKDITDVVTQEIERYTRFTVAPLVTSAFPDIEDVDNIIITGGGALIISQDVLRDEIGEDYFGYLHFSKEAQFNNVRGFYKNGALVWTDEIEISIENKNIPFLENRPDVVDEKEEEKKKALENFDNAQKELQKLSEELTNFE